MTSKYEKTQGTKIFVSSAATTEANPSTGVVWLQANCATREISYTAGQKADIDVTTLCSSEQEMTNGLPSPGEMTLSRNWSADETAQYSLSAAYDTDELRSIRVIFPSGNGYAYLAEVRQNSWSAGTSGVVSASFTLRIKGKPVQISAVAVPVTGVTLNKTATSVAVGNTGNLIPTITPQNATDKTGVFLSSEPETATIDPGTGEYEGVAAGTADLTFTTNDGAKTAVCVLTVTA